VSEFLANRECSGENVNRRPASSQRPEISVLRMGKQEGYEFKVSLDYIMRLCLKRRRKRRGEGKGVKRRGGEEKRVGEGRGGEIRRRRRRGRKGGREGRKKKSQMELEKEQ
jgi:hypothetical protein